MATGYWKGKKLPQAVKEKMSLVKKGKTPSNLAVLIAARRRYKMTESDRKRLSETHRRIGTKPPSRRGTVPWNYRGATRLQEQIRKCFEYRQWRSDVYTRDDFTCRRCFKKGGVINADHIKEFSKILKEYQINTFQEALQCSELWNINNGRTLCKPCHKSRKAWDEEMVFLEDL